MRIWRYLNRKIDSLGFWLRHPASIRVETLNSSSIRMGSGTRVGLFGRIYVNDPNLGSRVELADSVWLGRNVELQVWGGQKVRLMRKVTVQDTTKILGDVEIGAYSTLASNIFISSGNHQFKAEPALLIKTQDKKYSFKSEPIYIGEDVWIGANVYINHGVTIGRGAVVGANAVVNSNIEPYTIYGGVPAKKIGSRLIFNPTSQISAERKSDRIFFYKGFDHENDFEHGMLILSSPCTVVLANRQEANQVAFKIYSENKNEVEFRVGESIMTKELRPGLNDIRCNAQIEIGRELNIALSVRDMQKGALYVQSVNIA